MVVLRRTPSGCLCMQFIYPAHNCPTDVYIYVQGRNEHVLSDAHTILYMNIAQCQPKVRQTQSFLRVYPIHTMLSGNNLRLRMSVSFLSLFWLNARDWVAFPLALPLYARRRRTRPECILLRSQDDTPRQVKHLPFKSSHTHKTSSSLSLSSHKHCVSEFFVRNACSY